jgi:hypothetical protein
MAYLIDGNNLLGRIAPHELRERGGREGLVVRLLAFQRLTRTRIHVVFDGSPEEEPVADVLNPKFTVHYPGRGRAPTRSSPASSSGRRTAAASSLSARTGPSGAWPKPTACSP